MNILRELFLKNLTLKAIAATLALLLWMQIAGQQRVQRSVAIPLDFTNMSADLEITNDYPRQINVRFSRPSSLRMDEQRLAVVMDLGGIEASSVVLPITEENIRNLPAGVRIEGIEQRRIHLQLEEIRQKIVRVEPEILGQPAAGYVFVEARMNPSEVLISGPESRIANVSTAMTEAINIDGRETGFKQTAYLDLEDPRLRIETGATVEVVVFIEEERRELSTRIPVKIVPDTIRARSSYRTIKMIYSIPISYSEEIDKSGFFATAGLEQELPVGESVEVTPVVVIPEEYRDIVRLESIEPKQVRITF